LWELRIKESLHKIKLPKAFFSSLEPAGYELLPVAIPHVEALGKLPMHHRDPFDRMLVAQALTENLILVTRDKELLRYPVKNLQS
jgi:PIN domain nuclease of toxin-antitoxin system